MNCTKLFENVLWYQYYVEQPKREYYDYRTGQKRTYRPTNLKNKLTDANCLIICWDPPESWKWKKAFAAFKNYSEFYKFLRKVPGEERCFFECIVGSRRQKPHFDIDISKVQNKEQICEQLTTLLVQTVEEILAEYNMKLNISENVLIYSSHDPVNEKVSRHIVINGFFHSNNDEARAFYELCLARIGDRAPTNYIDQAVYSSFQQFRIAGCCKRGTGRYKEPLPNFKIGDIEYSHVFANPDNWKIETLQESLVGVVNGCIQLPNLIQEKDREYKTIYVTDDGIETINYHIKNTLQNAFTVRGDIDSMTCLKRNCPSYCKLCDRIHESENAYLTIRNCKLYFHCRRCQDNSELLGDIDTIPDELSIFNEEVFAEFSDCGVVEKLEPQSKIVKLEPQSKIIEAEPQSKIIKIKTKTNLEKIQDLNKNSSTPNRPIKKKNRKLEIPEQYLIKRFC